MATFGFAISFCHSYETLSKFIAFLFYIIFLEITLAFTRHEWKRYQNFVREAPGDPIIRVTKEIIKE
jgi:hypothetical protein